MKQVVCSWVEANWIQDHATPMITRDPRWGYISWVRQSSSPYRFSSPQIIDCVQVWALLHFRCLHRLHRLNTRLNPHSPYSSEALFHVIKQSASINPSVWGIGGHRTSRPHQKYFEGGKPILSIRFNFIYIFTSCFSDECELFHCNSVRQKKEHKEGYKAPSWNR